MRPEGRLSSPPTPHSTPRKRGAPKSSPRLTGHASRPSRHLHAARRARHLARVQTARADLHLRHLAVHERAHDLEVRLPRPTRLVVRVRDVVTERDAFVAVEAAIALNGHDSILTELDARHLRAVTLAVPGLEDARVAAVPRGEPRPDLLEQLV